MTDDVVQMWRVDTDGIHEAHLRQMMARKVESISVLLGRTVEDVSSEAGWSYTDLKAVIGLKPQLSAARTWPGPVEVPDRRVGKASMACEDSYGRVSYLGTGIGTLDGARRYLKNKFNQGPLGPVVRRRGARFYVSSRRGVSTQLLLGPYASHMTAMANVPRAERLARERGLWSFVALGTMSLPISLPTLFGR